MLDRFLQLLPFRIHIRIIKDHPKNLGLVEDVTTYSGPFMYVGVVSERG